MPTFYLTPASISYLTQFLVACLISLYLVWRFFISNLRPASKQDHLLVAFFFTVLLFSLSLFLDVSLLPSERLVVVFLQTPVLGLMLVFLIQFAYQFPAQQGITKLEQRLALFLTIVYTLWETVFCFWRFIQLGQGQVEYRPEYLDYFPIVGFLWVVLVFARSSFQNWEFPENRRFAFIFLLPLSLAAINLLSSLDLVDAQFYYISTSIGILLTLYLFALNYLVSKPEATSLLVKLLGAAITSGLSFFGMVAWLVTPAYAAQYQPALPDQRTISFTPNQLGGYDLTEIDLHFVEPFGKPLQLTDSSSHQVSFKIVNFEFPFYGKRYQKLYILDDGLISFDPSVDYKDIEWKLASFPAILGLTLDLDPTHNPDGGVFLYQNEQELVVTYYQVSSFSHPENKYTFQIHLYSNGNFEISFNGLPSHHQYYINDDPQGAVMVWGAKPAQETPATTSVDNLPLKSGPDGVIRNEFRAFRANVHAFLLPLTLAILMGCMLFIIGLPLVINILLLQPLTTLINGVVQMNQGKLTTDIPVRHNDEIGFLTRSFNNLARELDGMIKNLENRVADRTNALLEANEQLRKLSMAVEQSPNSIMITDLNANIEYVNPAFTLTTGYSSEDVHGKNPRILKSNQTPPQTFQHMWETLLAGEIWRGELSNCKKNGEVYWESTVIAPIRADNTVITHYVAVKEDITHRKQIEQSLRESEKQYRDLFEMESDAIFIIRNSDSAILKANKAATTLYGYSLSELLEMCNVDLSAEPEATQKATNTPFPTNQIVSVPIRWHRKKDGDIFPVEITARFIEWQNQPVHIAAIRDITKRQHIEKELERLAITDALTGISNRRHFFIEAEKIFQRCQSQPFNLTILMMDVDLFKKVNDTHGHTVGDVVLHEVARRLQENLRTVDLLARYGGEEFIAIIAKAGQSETLQIADRLVKAVGNKPVSINNMNISVTISMGLAFYSEQTVDLTGLLSQADKALYAAKQNGRNRWAIWKDSEKPTPSQ